MRRPLILTMALAVTTLFVVAPAAAHADRPDEVADPCPRPVVAHGYDTEYFSVAVSLPATGCPAREQRQFPLWVSVTRYDETSAHGATRGVVCGPFRPSSDIEPGRHYSCDVDIAVDHPPVEAAHYSVEITYPGSGGEEVFAFESFCVSDDFGATCIAEEE